MDAVWASLETGASRLGLNHPGARILFGAALATTVMWAAQPSGMFLHGRPRPFAAWTHPDNTDIAPTKWPWWIAPLAGAFVAGVLI